MTPDSELNRKHDQLLRLMTGLTQDVAGFKKDIRKDFADLKESVKPSVDAYKAWMTLGGWGKTFLYIVGAILGLILTWRQVFPHK